MHEPVQLMVFYRSPPSSDRLSSTANLNPTCVSLYHLTKNTGHLSTCSMFVCEGLWFDTMGCGHRSTWSWTQPGLPTRTWETAPYSSYNMQEPRLGYVCN